MDRTTTNEQKKHRRISEDGLKIDIDDNDTKKSIGLYL